MTTAPPTLDDVLVLAQRLAPADKARLIARLAPQLAPLLEAAAPHEPFPVITVGAWSDDLPLRREELYDDRGRA